MRTAAKIYDDLMIPEGIVQRRLGKYYKDHPIMSRVFATTVALFSGIIKPFLFPVISLIGMIALPIIALVRAFQGEKTEALAWLKATGLCVLGVIGSIAFLGVMCYCVPLVTSCALIVVFIALSIIFHTKALVQEPNNQVVVI